MSSPLRVAMIVGIAVETTVCSSELTAIASNIARVTSPRPDPTAPATPSRMPEGSALTVPLPAASSAIVPPLDSPRKTATGGFYRPRLERRAPGREGRTQGAEDKGQRE